MPSGPTEIMAAIATGLATVTNLATSTVTVNDYRVLNNAYAVVITPGLAGEQSLSTVGGWEQVHRINVLLSLRSNDISLLFARGAAMIPLVLAWFRTNHTLGLADVLGCQTDSEPIRWASTTGANEFVDDGSGVLRKEIVFTVPVWVTI